jgi:hypothetical protein
MKHLEYKILMCERDYKGFQQGNWYKSSKSNGNTLNIILDGKFVAVDDKDLLQHFKVVLAEEALGLILFDLQSSLKNPYLDTLTSRDIVEQHIATAHRIINSYKSVAI